MRKSLASLLILLFLTSLIALPSATVKAESKTIVVPDDYSTIASAVGNATNGDIISVKSGTYQESAINTNKSLSIRGEGYQSTRINFETKSYEVDGLLVDKDTYAKYTFHDPAILVYANDFRLSGFTINSNGGKILINGNSTQVIANSIGTPLGASGSYLFVMGNMFSNLGLNANYSRISNNVITSGIFAGGQYTIFSFNNITNSAPSLETNACLIYGNSIVNAPYAIFPLYGNDNIVSHNIIDDLSFGLKVSGLNNTVMLNQITHCGVALRPSFNNTYYANYIANSGWGIDTVGSLLNPNGDASGPFHNNLVNNRYQVSTFSHYKPDYFDNGVEGNYWSDYHGKDANGDGIGDTPYIIDANRSDRYPLIAPFNTSNVPDLIPDWALPPSVQLINPVETTYSSGNITLDFVISKQPTWISYCLDGNSNVTITGNTTLINLASGAHNITVYANDWYQNTGVSKTVTFTMAEPFPTATVIVVSVAIVAIVDAGLLVYFKKYHKKKQLTKQSFLQGTLNF